jgi:hypothetical protein
MPKHVSINTTDYQAQQDAYLKSFYDLPADFPENGMISEPLTLGPLDKRNPNGSAEVGYAAAFVLSIMTIGIAVPGLAALIFVLFMN